MLHYSRRQALRTAALGAAALASQGWAAGAPLPAAAGNPPLGRTRKKGVCGGIHGTQGLATLKAGWFYSWGSTVQTPPPPGVEWIPQIFPHKKEDIAKSCARVKAAGSKTLLGYNEPDHPGQGDISVEIALEHWPKLMETGLRLISPGTTWAPGGWMKNFMRQAEARKFRVDAVAIHWYGMPNPEAFLKYVTAAHQDYGRPIWITEFAVHNKHASNQNPSKVRSKEVINFLRQVLPELEKLPWVERYCLYAPHHPNSPKEGTSCLFGDDGKLTDVGAYFASLP